MRASSFQLTTGFGFAPDFKKKTRYMTSELSKRKTEQTHNYTFRQSSAK